MDFTVYCYPQGVLNKILYWKLASSQGLIFNVFTILTWKEPLPYAFCFPLVIANGAPVPHTCVEHCCSIPFNCFNHWSRKFLVFFTTINTIFTRIDAVAFISFFTIQLRHLFGGVVYSKITLFSTKYRTTYGNFLLGNSNKSLH